MDMHVAGTILAIPRDCFAPEDVYSVCYEVALFSQFNRADQRMGEYLEQFDVLRRRSGSKMQVAGASPETILPALCM